MNEKRRSHLAKAVYNRETGSTGGAMGDLKSGVGVSEKGAQAAQDAVRNQTKIEASKHERQAKARVARAKVKLKEKAAAKRNPMAPEGKMKDVGRQYPNVNVAPEMGPDKTPPMK